MATPEAVEVPPAPSASAPEAPPELPAPLASVAASPPPAEGIVVLFVDTARLRAHPRAARLGPLLATLPGLPSLAKRVPGFDPIRDADWIVVTGPDLGVLGARGTALVHLAGDEAKASRTFGPVSKLDPAHPPLGPVRVRARDVLVPGPTALAADVARFERPPAEASGAGMWLSIEGLVPGVRTPLFADARAIVVRVDGVAPADAAAARAEVRFDDEAAAGAFVVRAREEVARQQKQVFVRLALRGLLDGVTVEPLGRLGVAKVHARPEHLDAVMNLVEAMAGLPPPAPPPP